MNKKIVIAGAAAALALGTVAIAQTGGGTTGGATNTTTGTTTGTTTDANTGTTSDLTTGTTTGAYGPVCARW